jgi:sodium/potassium/calcium exchanger 4
MENGNVPVENPEDPQQGQEQQPPPQPPPPEPESVETVFLSPFSMPGESGGASPLARLLGVTLGPCLGHQDGDPDPGVVED